VVIHVQLGAMARCTIYMSRVRAVLTVLLLVVLVPMCCRVLMPPSAMQQILTPRRLQLTCWPQQS
jgi:hypothetical protein